MNTAENIACVRARMEAAAQRAGARAGQARLMAVTKTVEPARINEAIRAGIDLIGENRVQELLAKYDELNLEGVEVHLIGHLQRNKVKYIIDKVDMIESVDSCELADEIQRQACAHGKIMPVLAEVHVGGEESKFGVEPGELRALLTHISRLSHVKVCGLMTVPPPCDDREQAKKVFSQFRALFLDIRAQNIHNIDMKMCSMGMSADFEAAVEEGSDEVRIGSAIFGRRFYQQ